MQGIPQGPNSQGGSSSGSQKPSLSWQNQGAPNKSFLQTPPEPVKPAQTTKSHDKAGREATSMSTFVGIFVAGLVVGVLLGWGIVTGRSGTTATTSTATSTSQESNDTSKPTGESSTESSEALLPSTTGDITVATPQKAGTVVAVAKVDVSKPTWVVVYDNNDGVPGRALGATLFFPASANGETSGTISLLRGTVAGNTYLVGQLLDDGDPNLSFKTDKPIVDANGKALLTTLTAN